MAQVKILTRNIGSTDSKTIQSYLKNGGYETLKKALSLEPAKIVEEVKDSGLRGRGGAGFPTGTKWSFLPKNSAKPVYLVCNADEGEPGTFKDRYLMENDPHLLLEGMIISAYAIQAAQAFIYIRGEFGWIADILETAINEAYQNNFLGQKILKSAFSLDIVVHRGAGSYICGEETALIESLEGKRGNPRLKPPFPANIGLYQAPTIINNVETLCFIPYILEKGTAEFKKIGPSNNFGTKLFSISGHVQNPGVYEFPMGIPFADLLKEVGGMRAGAKLKAVIPGGLSTPILKAEEAMTVSMDFDSLAKAGSMLGSGGVIILDDSTAIPQIALRTAQFYKHESCGQCIPCRLGSKKAVYILKRHLNHQSQGDGEIQKLMAICKNLKGNSLSLCPMGDAFATPLSAMIQKFPAEFNNL